MISVIIPNHNCGRLLGRCLRSVREQTYRDWECIIVDDGSTDESMDVLGNVSGPRFTVIHSTTSNGVSAARNEGIRRAKGEALFFLDSDDWVERSILQELIADSMAHPEAGRIICPDYLEFPERGWAWKHLIEPAGLHRPDSPDLFSSPDCDVGHVTGCLYIRDRIPCELEFPRVKIFEDMIFNMGLIFAGMSTYINRKYLYRYVRREGSLITTRLSEEDVEKSRKALADLSDKYHPSTEVYARCQKFLENALKGKMK